MPLERPLTHAEARVLGSLIEKEITTPEYYPLSLNALVNACNQKNNREPVTDFDDETVRQALHGLEDQRLAGPARSDGRVPKYEHRLGEVFNFSRAETAIACVLLLRGPQTPGELRGRTDRMYRFEELGDVLSGLQKLMDREPPLAMLLPRQPGAREARYAQLLSPAPESGSLPAAQTGTMGRTGSLSSSTEDSDLRIAQLEQIVAQLREEVAALRARIDDLFG